MIASREAFGDTIISTGLWPPISVDINVHGFNYGAALKGSCTGTTFALLKLFGTRSGS
jgi:hypothetical protein